MAFFKIPTSSTLPWYNFKISLSGVMYSVDLRYNVRMQRWVMNLLDASDNPLLMGIVMLNKRDVIGQYVTLKLPPGILFCLDNTGNNLEATLGSFSTTNTIYYATPL